MIPGKGAAHGSPRRGTKVFVMSMDTSVPRQRDASDAALVDMLMLEAPVGLALFGPDSRFRWVNAALTRLGGQAEADASGPLDWTGLLPSEAWPGPVATRAETALRKVLDEGVPLTERGYPAVSPPAASAAEPAATAPASVVPVGGASALDVPAGGAPEAGPEDTDMSGCASWFPVHDAAGKVFGVGLIMLNIASLSTAAVEAAAAEIRRSEERYRSLVQGGAQVVWVAAPDGAMKEDSPEWRWITGQSEEQYTGYGWLESVHPEDRERVERDWRECVLTGTGSAPRPAPTGTMTCARCRSSGTGRSSSGSAPAPTSPASARPRRCAAG